MGRPCLPSPVRHVERSVSSTGLCSAAPGKEMQQLVCAHLSQLFLMQDKGMRTPSCSHWGWLGEAASWAVHHSDQPHRSVCSGCSRRKPVVPSRGWKTSTSQGRPGCKCWRSPTQTSPGSCGSTSTWWRTPSSCSSCLGSCCEYSPKPEAEPWAHTLRVPLRSWGGGWEPGCHSRALHPSLEPGLQHPPASCPGCHHLVLPVVAEP